MVLKNHRSWRPHRYVTGVVGTLRKSCSGGCTGISCGRPSGSRGGSGLGHRRDPRNLPMTISDHPGPHRRFQFHLRSFLTFVTIAGVVLGLAGRYGGDNLVRLLTAIAGPLVFVAGYGFCAFVSFKRWREYPTRAGLLLAVLMLVGCVLAILALVSLVIVILDPPYSL